MNTVAASMARQGLVARPPKRKRALPDPPRQGGRADPGPGQAGLHGAGDQPLVRRPDRDPHRRGQALPGHRAGPRLAAAPRLRPVGTSRLRAGHGALCMAAAVRGGDVAGVIFHTDKGGEYIGELFAPACTRWGSPSRWAGSARLDNAAAESFNSTLEHELFRARFATKQTPAARSPGSSTPTTTSVGTAPARCCHPSPTRPSSPLGRRHRPQPEAA